MYELIIGVCLGVIAALLVAFLLRARSGGRTDGPRMDILASIENMRSIGELSAFKVLTKEIVTARDHWAGEFGKKYLEWLVTSKKTAMIFEFDIDFRYDLRDPGFRIVAEPTGEYTLLMPECKYEIHIRDISFYDEQKRRLFPWLLPDVLNNVFGGGFDEEERNRLKEEAKQQAYTLARELVKRLRSDVQNSARETMDALARGFEARISRMEFKDSEPQQVDVHYAAE